MPPLGVPVLPLEKMTAATSSGFVAPARLPAGNNRAAAMVRALDVGLNVASTSSKKTVPGSSGSLAFSRKVGEERMVEIPHTEMACAMASSPEVKFRFTAVLPASVTPRLASAPPTDEGSNSPTQFDPTHFALIHFFKSSAAVSVSPKLSCLPVESAIAMDDQRRLAAVMNRWDSVLDAFLRYSAAWVPSSSTRWCTGSELTSPVIGLPTYTVTSCRSFNREENGRPPFRLRAWPHRPSR